MKKQTKIKFRDLVKTIRLPIAKPSRFHEKESKPELIEKIKRKETSLDD